MALSVSMLRHVLGVCRELEGVQSLLLSAPADLRPIADEFGAGLLEGGVRGMRRDVTEAALGGLIASRAALLFVSSDLPLLTINDLRLLVAQWRAGADLVLAPDGRERGTNALLVNEPETFPFAFGEVLGAGSFHTHLGHAVGHDLQVAQVRTPGLMLDIDLPSDLADFLDRAPASPLAQYCKARLDDHFRFE